MQTQRYNGWTNYETWAVKLWMDNEESSNYYWSEAARDAWDAAEADETFSRKERAALDLADKLKDEYEDAKPEVDGVWADLLNAAMSEVNWMEIAENMLTDADESEPEDE